MKLPEFFHDDSIKSHMLTAIHPFTHAKNQESIVFHFSLHPLTVREQKRKKK